jgi:hypothetical protein
MLVADLAPPSANRWSADAWWRLGHLMAAFQAGAAAAAHSLGERAAALSPCQVERARVFSRGVGELRAWARARVSAEDERTCAIDIDVVDRFGSVCAQLRGVTFAVIQAPLDGGEWVFTRGQQARAGVESDAAHTLRCYLSDAAARQLRCPAATLPVDASFFDLGFDAGRIMAFVQDVAAFLGESLSPASLFDHRSLEALAAHLLRTCPEKVAGIHMSRRTVAGRGATAALTPLPRNSHHMANGGTGRATPGAGRAARPSLNEAALVEQVLWDADAAAAEDGYEKLTF